MTDTDKTAEAVAATAHLIAGRLYSIDDYHGGPRGLDTRWIYRGVALGRLVFEASTVSEKAWSSPRDIGRIHPILPRRRLTPHALGAAPADLRGARRRRRLGRLVEGVGADDWLENETITAAEGQALTAGAHEVPDIERFGSNVVTAWRVE